MPAYHVSPSGLDANDGLSELNPKPPAWLSTFVPEPGDAVRLQAGAVFPLAIDWAWKNIGDPDHPILLDRYGRVDLPNPVVASPVDVPGFNYVGSGGINLGAIRFSGRCFVPGVSGVSFGTTDKLRNIRLTGTEVCGYTEAGIYISGAAMHSASDVLLAGLRLWGNGKGTYLWGIDGLEIDGGDAFGNDWAWELTPPGNVGQGWAVFASRNIQMRRCKARRNGRLTRHSGGCAGFFFQDCILVRVKDCESIGNWDATEQDGQGYILVNCEDVEILRCLSQGNLHGGFSLFNDTSVSTTRLVRRCHVRHCWSVDDVVGLAVAGSVLDCSLTHNHVRTHTRDGVYRKCLDVANDGPRRLSIWGNDFRLGGEGVVLEAAPGLTGISRLDANDWDHPQGVHRVRGRDFDKIGDALAAEPVSL